MISSLLLLLSLITFLAEKGMETAQALGSSCHHLEAGSRGLHLLVSFTRVWRRNHISFLNGWRSRSRLSRLPPGWAGGQRRKCSGWSEGLLSCNWALRLGRWLQDSLRAPPECVCVCACTFVCVLDNGEGWAECFPRPESGTDMPQPAGIPGASLLPGQAGWRSEVCGHMPEIQTISPLSISIPS